MHLLILQDDGAPFLANRKRCLFSKEAEDLQDPIGK
jgi:hypothetical protein